jgi:hypothetical protein
MKRLQTLTALCLACLLLSACNDGAATTTAKPNQRLPGDSGTGSMPKDPLREMPQRPDAPDQRNNTNGGGGDMRVPDHAIGGDTQPRPNSPVPEPGTLFLVGSGLAGLALLQRRRRNQAARQ